MSVERWFPLWHKKSAEKTLGHNKWSHSLWLAGSYERILSGSPVSFLISLCCVRYFCIDSPYWDQRTGPTGKWCRNLLTKGNELGAWKFFFEVDMTSKCVLTQWCGVKKTPGYPTGLHVTSSSAEAKVTNYSFRTFAKRFKEDTMVLFSLNNVLYYNNNSKTTIAITRYTVIY